MKKRETASTPHTALYRKYRPRSLDDFVGQSHVVEVLRRSLQQNKIAHAYLLTGPRGVGKTSIARILAHEINKLPYGGEETHLDIIEIDAASNNGVDDVRELRDRVQMAPIAAAKKVYIIDEVHMLSKQAFNALLKTLEEPPAHVVFILATTDPQKIPATIISRTQHFAIHTYGVAEVVEQLKRIAEAEKIKITDEAAEVIASRGEGSFRDSISLLDQLSSFADEKEGITLELVQSTLGLAPIDAVNKLFAGVDDRNVATVVSLLNELENQGVQPVVLADQLIRALRDKLVEQPQLVGLLDALIAVSMSPQPQLKLLTTLVAVCKPKTVAAAVTRTTKPMATVIEAPVIVVEKPVPAERQGPVEKQPAEMPVNETPAPAPAPAKPAAKKHRTEPFEWSKIVGYVKEHFVALYSVLGKCDYEYEGDTLTIYAVRKFNKTKLDQAKYLTQLQEALEQCGQPGMEVVTLPIAKPPSDEKLAKVAAMMGGGQEVKLEEVEKVKTDG